MNKPILCIYHGNCADGFTAAWVLRNALGEENVEFHAGFYGTPPPIVSLYQCVYLVDFSYKRPVMLDLAAQTTRLVVIDHHKTAQEDLVDLPSNVECHFDMNHSGAMLTWMYFQPDFPFQDNDDAPALIQRVEDRDLWRFKFHDTREVQANVFSYEYTFENWDKLAKESMAELAQGGAAIERKHFKDIRELLSTMKHKGSILTHEVPMANLPYIYSSDAGHIMGEGEKFAACYWFTSDGIVFSLRSAEDGMDVSEIAKHFGGGGHKHAAGFNLSYADFHKRQHNETIILGDMYDSRKE